MSARTRDIWVGLLWRGFNVLLLFLGYFMRGLLDASVLMVEKQPENWWWWTVLNVRGAATLVGLFVISN